MVGEILEQHLAAVMLVMDQVVVVLIKTKQEELEIQTLLQHIKEILVE